MFKPVSPAVNFPELEKQILKYWQTNGIVEKYLHRNDYSNKRFSFLDGPITANNPMGVHHAWGRTYKDLWQRYFNMKGYRQRFQNGFDCQGLWIEVEVEKELKIRNKKDIENLVPGDRKKSIAKFVQMCKDRVLKFSSIQTAQSKRLGYTMDWDNSYYTMSEENNYMIWHFLKVCHENGWIYKGTESVPWCPRCETAISQHEMLTEDYKEVSHKSIYMLFPLVGVTKEYLLVWTTTPWTIVANIAVAVDEKLEYSLVENKDGKKLWVAREAVERLFGKNVKIVKTVLGSKLEGKKYSGAFDGLEAVNKVSENRHFHTVIPTDSLIMPITTTEGTGLVHTAVSAGEEDFRLGKKLGLPMISVIADDASYLPGLGFLTGKNAKKHPELILDYLEEKGYSEKTENYLHRYPACWRCKTELVWKVTDEWYIAMDKKESGIKNPIRQAQGKQEIRIKNRKNKTLRERMIEVAKKIHWIPDFGLERELDWLKNMHDWLVSKKNRYWGLALPIFECQNCGWFDVVGSRDELKNKAVSGWYEFTGHSPHKPYIDEISITCGKCRKSIKRIDDVGNVWLDAGIVPYSTYIDPDTKKLSYTTDKKYWNDWFPADFITESFPGQFKNWFYSMIAMSAVLEQKIPYKTVLGFGSMLGEDGRPMHKSWGNSIEFNEGADKIGVDVMRWMFCVHNPELNLLFGYKKADETRRKFHLILWNIYNFYITYANLIEVTSQKSVIRSKNILDRWILSKLNNLNDSVQKSLDEYDASSAAIEIENFVTDLSQWYVRRSRDRVSPVNPDISDKNQCLQVLHQILVTISCILAPFTPYLAEEIFRNLTGKNSVHLTDWPRIQDKLIDNPLEGEMLIAREISEKGHSIRKSMGFKVRKPLLELDIEIDTDVKTIRDDVLQLVLDELNVKNINLNGKTPFPYKKITVTQDMLTKEGEARELVRNIQLLRKEQKCELTSLINILAPAWPAEFEEYIKRETLAKTIRYGEQLAISKV